MIYESTLNVGPLPHWAKWPVELALMALGYYIVGKLGLLLAISPGFAAPVWPASGIALAGTLLCGFRVWPGILLGSFLVNIGTSLEITGTASMLNATALATSIGIGASLQAIVGAFLIHRFVRYPSEFVEPPDIIKFLLLGGPVSCLVNATWGVTSLFLGGIIQPVDYLFHWWTWWIGDAIGVITFSPLVLIWAARSAAISRRRQIFVSVPLCLAFMMVVIFFIYTNSWEQNRVKVEFERRADDIAGQLQESFNNYIDVLHSVENIYASSVPINRQQFKTFVLRWFSQHPGIRAIAWNPRVQDAERMAYEQGARLDGLRNYQITEQNSQRQLVRAAQRAEYIPVYYLESVSGIGRSLGFDAASDPTRREALNRARDTGKPTATEPLTLIPNVEPVPGFVVYIPIYKSGHPQNSLKERRLNLEGYVSGVFRIAEMVQTSLRGANTKDLKIRLYDDNHKRGGEKNHHRLQLAEFKGRPAEAAQVKNAAILKQTIPFKVADRRWLIEFTPTKEYLVAQQGWQAWSALAGGLFFTGLLGSFILAVTGHAAKLQAINTELEKEIAERKAVEEEATKLAAIVESSDDAIIGTTLEGIITSWNKGAKIVYGYSAEEVKGRSILILYPPELSDELPRLREAVARDERVAQYETLRVRKNGTQVHISLTLSPLKDASGKITGVASISRDVTERKKAEAELQRQRESVAQRLHDSVLQSMTAIGLHLELAQNVLTDDPARAGQHLAIIERVLQQEQRNLRSFVKELNGLRVAPNAEYSGEIATLEKLVRRLESQWRVRIQLEVERGGEFIPKPIVDDLCYLIQEGVSNAVRHGPASIVNIQMGLKDEYLVMRIMDNGGGFPFQYDEDALAANLAGPTMLRSRIASLGGSLSIRSADSGACLEIVLPLSRPGASHADHAGSLG